MKTKMYTVGQEVWYKADPSNHGKGVVLGACAPDSRSDEPIYKINFQDGHQNGWYTHSEITNIGPKHKHADLMLEYAKESFTNATAYKNWEFSPDSGDTWNRCIQHPTWTSTVLYRRKPVVIATYKPVKEKIEFIKPVKNVNDLIGIDVLYVIKANIDSSTYRPTNKVVEVNISQMTPYDINHLIQNNLAFATEEHVVSFLNAYDKMKQYMR